MNATVEDAIRQQAAIRSRDCPHCEGHGVVLLYDRRYDGRSVVYFTVRDGPTSERRVPIAMRTMTQCLCPLGEWHRARISPELKRLMPDFVAILEGRTRWMTEDPTATRKEAPPCPSMRTMSPTSSSSR